MSAVASLAFAGVADPVEWSRYVRWNIIRSALRHAVAHQAGKHRPISDFERRNMRASLAHNRAALARIGGGQ